jgi:hypothetical protein
MKSLLILAVVSVVLLVQTQGFGGAVPKREARLDVSLPKATSRKVIGSFVVGSAIFGMAC